MSVNFESTDLPTVEVYISGESGPWVDYHRAWKESDAHGEHTVTIPKALWDDYATAADAKDDAVRVLYDAWNKAYREKYVVRNGKWVER